MSKGAEARDSHVLCKKKWDQIPSIPAIVLEGCEPRRHDHTGKGASPDTGATRLTQSCSRSGRPWRKSLACFA